MSNSTFSPPFQPRSCGSCSLCCKLIGIAELNKPIGQWCPNCIKSGGCSIYDSRPTECRTFNCEWLIAPGIGDEWRPTRAKMVLHNVPEGEQNKLVVHVDPGSPLAWKNEPYYSQLKRWAQQALQNNGMVNIYVGRRVIVILPDKDVDLGIFSPGDRINLRKRRIATDFEYEVFKIPARPAPERLG